MTENDRDPDRFDDALREWARRPPRATAPVAARRVTARLGPSDRSAGRAAVWVPRLAAACGLALVVASGALLWRNAPPPPAPSPAADAPPVLPENVVVFWLDPDTPVYFVVRPLEDAQGATP